MNHTDLLETYKKKHCYKFGYCRYFTLGLILIHNLIKYYGNI